MSSVRGCSNCCRQLAAGDQCVVDQGKAGGV